MNQVRYGIIGMGNQGSSYLYGLFEKGLVEGAVVTAVCDINPAKLTTVKEKSTSQGISYFENYMDLLDSGLVDAILVETPHYDHPAIVIEALKRGIHALCDKPAGVYTKQVREMNEVAEGANALFGMMFNQRTNHIYRKMKELIAEGAIGQLQRVNWIITDWYRTQFYYDSGNWRATWAGEGGGVLINQCPHQIDLLSWITGVQPSAVRGFCQYGRWHDIEVEDEVTAYLEYDCGATGTLITTTGETPGTNRLEISGTKGKLLAEGGILQYFRNDQDTHTHTVTAQNGFSRPKCDIIQVETDGKNPQHQGILQNFTNTILGTETLFATGVSGINGVDLMNAIELSGWLDGARVPLPVDEDLYLAELNKRRATSRLKTGTDLAATSTEGTY